MFCAAGAMEAKKYTTISQISSAPIVTRMDLNDAMAA